MAILKTTYGDIPVETFIKRYLYDYRDALVDPADERIAAWIDGLIETGKIDFDDIQALLHDGNITSVEKTK
jgi:hypothetical protein